VHESKGLGAKEKEARIQELQEMTQAVLHQIGIEDLDESFEDSEAFSTNIFQVALAGDFQFQSRKQSSEHFTLHSVGVQFPEVRQSDSSNPYNNNYSTSGQISGLNRLNQVISEKGRSIAEALSQQSQARLLQFHPISLYPPAPVQFLPSQSSYNYQQQPLYTPLKTTNMVLEISYDDSEGKDRQRSSTKKRSDLEENIKSVRSVEKGRPSQIAELKERIL